MKTSHGAGLAVERTKFTRARTLYPIRSLLRPRKQTCQPRALTSDLCHFRTHAPEVQSPAIVLRAVCFLGMGWLLGIGWPPWHRRIATNKCAEGGDRFVSPYRISILDRDHGAGRCLGCSRCRLRAVPGAGSPVSNRETADHCDRSVVDAIFGCGRER